MSRERPTSRRLRAQIVISTFLTVAIVGSLAVVIAGGVGSADTELTRQQQTVILKLESVLLHDTVEPQYFRVTVQPGQGYVAGIADFATADGSAAEVIESYTARVGDNVLSRDFGQAIARLAGDRSGDTVQLEGYADAWRLASRDPVFRQVQDNVLMVRYLTPAIDVAQANGVRSPLGIAIFLDTLLQHGDGTDPDGLPALVDRTTARQRRPTDAASERRWLAAFLEVREETLVDPVNAGHREFWPLSVGRVAALAELVRLNALPLAPPVLANPYGLAHTIDAEPPQLALPAQTTPSAGITTAVGATSTPASSPSASLPPVVATGSAGGPTDPRPSAAATIAPPVRREGQIRGIGGLCLDLNNANPAPAEHIKIWTCNQTEAQHWLADTDGTLRILGMCAQPKGGTSVHANQLEIHPCDPAVASQQWRFVDGQLRNAASARCAAVPGDSAVAGTEVVVADCGHQPGQRWTPPS